MFKHRLSVIQKIIAYGSLLVVIIWMLGIVIFFLDLLFKAGD